MFVSFLLRVFLQSTVSPQTLRRLRLQPAVPGVYRSLTRRHFAHRLADSYLLLLRPQVSVSDGSGRLIWAPDLPLAERGLGVVDTASLLPAAGTMQAGFAAEVAATSTGATGCTAIVEELLLDRPLQGIALTRSPSLPPRSFRFRHAHTWC